MERRIITTELASEELRFEQSLRPQRLQEYIGQKKLKSMLQVYIEAARQRGGESRSRALLRAARTRKDNPFRHHCQ